jgi:hypothetical protein
MRTVTLKAAVSALAWARVSEGGWNLSCSTTINPEHASSSRSLKRNEPRLPVLAGEHCARLVADLQRASARRHQLSVATTATAATGSGSSSWSIDTSLAAAAPPMPIQSAGARREPCPGADDELSHDHNGHQGDEP